MIREHGAAALGFEQIDRVIECTGQHVEFAVDLDANRLERALGRMPTAASRGRGYRVAHDLAQFDGGRDRPSRHDRARDPRCEPFVAVTAQHLGETAFVVVVDHGVGTKGLAPIHAHVERTFGAVRETAAGAIELRRAHSEVEEERGNGVDAQRMQFGRDAIEARTAQHDAIAEAGQRLCCSRKRVVVTIEPDQRDISVRFEDGACMTTAADRGVDHNSRIDRLERVEDFGQHDRFVDERMLR